MSDVKRARHNLEKLLSRTFSDYQWSLIAAQGYEDAIVSGARTAEDVAEELRGLIETAGRRTAQSGEGPGAESALTWDEMEKLVLGRLLAPGVAGGPKPNAGPISLGTRARRLAADRERNRRRLWIIVSTALGVLAIALVTILVFGGLQCGLGSVQAESTTSTSESVGANTDAMVLPVASTTTTTSLAPETTVPDIELPDYIAQLSGAEAIPAVETEAGGSLELTLSKDGQTVQYVLTLENIDELTLARLRAGRAGETGDQIFTVYPGPTKEGVFSGVAAEGSLGAEDLVGPLEGKTIADFVALLEEGSVYVVVGTTEHRGGELRGQLK